MKRSEINAAAAEAREFFAEHQFYLPVWVDWSLQEWKNAGVECDEIRNNSLGWDVTDFGKGDFNKEGLTLITIRNGNAKLDNKVYCEKIMYVKENQVTPIHFHWKKMEDIINRGGGELCMKLWKANENEEITQEEKDDLKKCSDDIQEQNRKKDDVLAQYAKSNDRVHQLIDLALLQNGMLKGESLTRFVKRSIDLIK